MEYRTLGRTGVRISSLGFGTWTFGDKSDESESEAMFKQCLDAGINFFDTADVYAEGRSELILGKLMDGIRDELVVGSKVNFPTGTNINDRGLSRRHVTRAIEATLRRLGTDRLDIYFVHAFDDDTPIEETLRALDDLVHRGLVLYTGVSNWAAWQIAKALGLSVVHDLARFEVVQPMYSLVKRQAEVEILPMALSENLGVVAYSPLGGGLLTGRYFESGGTTSGRLVENPMYASRYGEETTRDVAARFCQFAVSIDVEPATLGVAWVASHPAVTAPILGARSAEQLRPSLAAATFEMTPELRQEISALTPPVPIATDRTEERLP